MRFPLFRPLLSEPRVHTGSSGLYPQIKPNGPRSWLLCYGKDGRTFWYGLGSTREVGMKEARERAEDLRVDIRRTGIHPVAARKVECEQAKAEAAAAFVEPRTAPTSRWCANQSGG